jgi:electron transfer flavoprotein beta subunit
MNIVVCVKETFDTETKIGLNQDGFIDESLAKYILNPFDEYAVEEAIRLTENEEGQVSVVSASRKDPSQALRHCLAMGVDRAVWLDCSGLNAADGHVYAEVLAQWISTQGFDLIFCGKEAVDDGSSEVPSRLAEILDLPQVNVVSKLGINGGKAEVRRDIDGGAEIIEAFCPFILSTQKGLNEPRYPSMRRVLQAKKMPVERVKIEELSLSEEALEPFTRVEEYILPPARAAGKLLCGSPQEAVAELITVLKDERKLI